MNQLAGKGYAIWDVNRTQSIFKKARAPFGFAEGQIFAEYDQVYLQNDPCCGGRDMSTAAVSIKKKTPPTNWQIPLVRKQ